MSTYYTNELKKIIGDARIQICDESGNQTRWLNINDESRAALIEWLTLPAPKLLHFTRVNSDGNGNPRFVVHYSQIADDYETALKIGRKIGGRKFHNKQYGGGIVFQSYSLDSEVKSINELTGSKYVGYDTD